jgi:hypothetical protein
MPCIRFQALMKPAVSWPLWVPSHSNQSPFISQPQRSSVGLPWAARLRAAAAITLSCEPLLICAYLTPVHEIISVLSPIDGRSKCSYPRAEDVEEPTERRTRELLEGYMAAWTAGDPEAFGRVLRVDAAIELLPSRVWFAGKQRCLAFAAPSMAWSWRMTATSANGQPAALAYLDGKPYGVVVLTPARDGIARVTVCTPVPAGEW